MTGEAGRVSSAWLTLILNSEGRGIMFESLRNMLETPRHGPFKGGGGVPFTGDFRPSATSGASPYALRRTGWILGV